MSERTDKIQGMITQIAMLESKTWMQLYAAQGKGGRPPQVSEVTAQANLACARMSLLMAIQHLEAQESKDLAEMVRRAREGESDRH